MRGAEGRNRTGLAASWVKLPRRAVNTALTSAHYKRQLQTYPDWAT